MRVHESFRSIQGEGKDIGLVTFFIRFSGCNLDCSWCDTRYASDRWTEMSVADVAVLADGCTNVCLTGGEPLLQNDIVGLMERFVGEGKHLVLETNGSKDISVVPDSKSICISMDIKCPSSGMSETMNYNNLALMKRKDQLKFVIADDADLRFALDVLAEYNPDTDVIFSPVGGMDIGPLAEKILASGIEARVLPQLHKIIWGDRTGV